MTSKLKCPVCGKTELIRMFNPLTGKYFEDYDCPFRLCNFRGNKVAVDALIQSQKDLENAKADIEDYKKYKALWEQIRNNTIIELERKLEITRNALEEIKKHNKAIRSVLGEQIPEKSTDTEEYCWVISCRIQDCLNNALKQITHDNSEKPNSQDHIADVSKMVEHKE